MEIELCAVSGYTEVGKNMSAVRIDNEVIIIDMGLDIGLIASQETEEGTRALSTDQLIELGAVPDDYKISDWKDKVKAIVLGHCHLDHIASVRYLAAKYKCPIIGTPYTIEVLKSMLMDDEIKLPNKFIVLNLDSKIEITNNITLEFVSVTHSTLQCAITVLHTKEGSIIYSNDFKFDNNPTIGSKTNFKRLKELGDSNKVLVLVMESMYVNTPGHTPGEITAKEKLTDIIENKSLKGKAVFVTMFSSHLARIKSAVELGNKIKRKVVIIGRSLVKYITAAENLKLIDITKKSELAGYPSQRKKILREVNDHRNKYLVICTGGQGEPGSILDRIINKQLPFVFKDNDVVIFSCSTIPQQINIANRERLEKLLANNKVEIFKDVHASGHAFQEDLKDMIILIKPKHLIPSQGEPYKISQLAEISEELGYRLNDTVHILQNGQRLRII